MITQDFSGSCYEKAGLHTVIGKYDDIYKEFD